MAVWMIVYVQGIGMIHRNKHVVFEWSAEIKNINTIHIQIHRNTFVVLK